MRACETSGEDITETGNEEAFTLRKATIDDVPQLIRLHRVAIRELGGSAYTADQIDSFLLHVPTLDDSLIDDRTYFVAEADGVIVGAGGWSYRSPSDMHTIDVDHATAAAEPAAVIRAMYTHPDWARRGIGRAILEAAEAEAAAAGYRHIELHALLPGVPLYRACGYTPIGRARRSSPTASCCRSSTCTSASTRVPLARAGAPIREWAGVARPDDVRRTPRDTPWHGAPRCGLMVACHAKARRCPSPIVSRRHRAAGARPRSPALPPVRSRA